MGEQEIKQLMAGMILPAAISIYAINHDKMTPQQAIVKANEIVSAFDLNSLISQLNAGI